VGGGGGGRRPTSRGGRALKTRARPAGGGGGMRADGQQEGIGSWGMHASRAPHTCLHTGAPLQVYLYNVCGVSLLLDVGMSQAAPHLRSRTACAP
jgi:hypothetical protein